MKTAKAFSRVTFVIYGITVAITASYTYCIIPMCVLCTLYIYLKQFEYILDQTSPKPGDKRKRSTSESDGMYVFVLIYSTLFV